ncbi:MAG TPA: hypothetical protein VFD67_11805 [Gemmatimonadaceae bacterium]|nr:hypothetical protein [Gemmatimonadaceae bacterium]
MLPLLLLQLAVGAPRADSVYSSPALASFIAAAAEANRVPPAALRRYHARIESELSLIVRDTLGRERAAQVEQLAMTAAWERNQRYDLRVIGYRSQSVGVPYSALSFARSWTIPYLYGDRLTLGVDFTQMSATGGSRRADSSSKPSNARRSDTLRAVHPLAVDRDRYYRFSGGDTIALLRSRDRRIPIVRVNVRPVFDSALRETRIGAFEGEIDFDAQRHQIVRMRGQFVATPGPRRSRSLLLRLPGIVAVAYVEYVNAEVDGQYWLPAFQRSEFQASVAPLGAQRSIFRLVSHFAGLDVVSDAVSADSDSTSRVVLAADERSQIVRRRLSFAPADSISRYREWIQPIGAATTNVSGSDFDDLSPDAWRMSGPPRADFTPTKLDEVFRFNRVEGVYTGIAVGERFRDAAPGLTAHAYGGWAWTEKTPRGGVSLVYRRGAWTTTARAERLLASTNDFTPPLEGGSGGFGALLFGIDDQDYVGRSAADVGLTRAIGSAHGALVTIQGGVREDRSESAGLERSVLGVGHYRLNRASASGSYAYGATTLEIHPDVTGLFLEPGIGLIASYELASGELRWQRAELMIAARKSISDLVLSTRIQGGLVKGRATPPQTLFELGGENALPGYDYKAFAGDRAATAGVLASYTSPFLRRPQRIIRSLMVPGLSPGIAAGIQAAWAEASSTAALASIQRLDPNRTQDCEVLGNCPAPLSVPTNGVRATADVRLTFFGGLIGVGMARPVDRSAPWRLAFRFGQEY